MSETVRCKGRLIPVVMTLEKVLKESKYEEFPDYYDLNDPNDWYNVLLDHNRPYMFIKGKWYKVKEEKIEDIDSFADIKENKDGTIDYHCMFYNGSCWLGEMIEEGLKE